MSRNFANLKPWPKGVSGNPGGRPRKLLTQALLRKMLENDEAETEKLVLAIIHKAQAGDVQAFNSIRDMVEGKPLQALSLGYDAGNEPSSPEEIDQRIRELEAELGIVRKSSGE